VGVNNALLRERVMEYSSHSTKEEDMTFYAKPIYVMVIERDNGRARRVSIHNQAIDVLGFIRELHEYRNDEVEDRYLFDRAMSDGDDIDLGHYERMDSELNAVMGAASPEQKELIRSLWAPLEGDYAIPRDGRAGDPRSHAAVDICRLFMNRPVGKRRGIYSIDLNPDDEPFEAKVAKAEGPEGNEVLLVQG
jgi:hypothetical protein